MKAIAFAVLACALLGMAGIDHWRNYETSCDIDIAGAMGCVFAGLYILFTTKEDK